MTPEDASSNGPSVIDTTAHPQWLCTGYKFFPYAAPQSGRWWVLRLNYGFPEHDMYTLFIDGSCVADITGDPSSQIPLAASIGSLQQPEESMTVGTMLDSATAATVVGAVAQFVNYGSERNDPCIFCSADHDGMTLA